MPVESIARKPAKFSLDSAGLEQLGRAVPVVFRPVWNVEKNYLCGYIVRPAGNPAPGVDAEKAAVLDIAVLQRAADALAQLQARGEKSVVVVPVGFETLNKYPWRGHYLSLLRRIPEGVRSFIVLQIGKIPQNAPKLRLQSIQGDVRNLCRAIVFTTDLRGGHLDCVSRQNVHACAVVLGNGGETDEDFIGTVNRFADKTSGINCAAMADGVSTQAALCAAVSAGFRYIAGRAVQPDQMELGISRRDFMLPGAPGVN